MERIDLMIKITNIKKIYYPKKAPQVVALDDVSLTFYDKGLYFIVGKSGSGKSTLLNILGGLDVPTSGTMEVNGLLIDNMSSNQLDAYRKSEVGFVFQDYNLLEELSVGENLRISLSLINGENSDGLISAALEEVGLNGYFTRKVSELSGGERQRVAIARAIIKSPSIVLADEPTGSLDKDTGEQIFEILKKLSSDKLVVVVSHDREMAEKYGDSIIEISQGKVVNENVTQTLTCEANPVTSETDGSRSKRNLSPKNVLSLGFKFMSKHIVRLIVSIILITFALTVFGIGVMASFFDLNQLAAEMLLNSGEKVVSLGAELKSDSLFSEYTHYRRMTDTQATKIENKLDEFLFGRIYNWEEINQINFNLSGEGGMLYTNTISGVTAVDQDSLDRWGFELVEGNLPQGLNEVAIPLYIAEYFKIYGIYDSEQGRVVKVNDYSELINKVNVDYTISGIIDTKFNMSRYGELAKVPNNITKEEYDRLYELSSQLESVREYSVHNALFVSQEYIDEFFIEKPRVYLIRQTQGSFWGGSQKDVSTASRFSLLKQSDIISDQTINDLADDEAIVSKSKLISLLIEYDPFYALNPEGITDEKLMEFISSGEASFDFMLTDDKSDALNQSNLSTFNIVGYTNVDNNISYYINNNLLEKTLDVKHIIVAIFTSLSDDTTLNKKLVEVSNDKSLDEDFIFPIRYWIYDDILSPSNVMAFMLSRIGLLSSIAFLIFAMLMIMNYLSSIISSSRRQIGVLRALGTGNREIFGIYSVESIIIGLVAFVLSTLLTFGVASILNSVFSYSYLNARLFALDWRSVLILFVTSLGSAVLGSLIPIIKLIRKKPIEIIRGAA